jgi:hypothetical protein
VVKAGPAALEEARRRAARANRLDELEPVGGAEASDRDAARHRGQLRILTQRGEQRLACCRLDGDPDVVELEGRKGAHQIDVVAR